MINEKITKLVEKSIQELEKTIIALIFYLESGKMLAVVWQTKMIKKWKLKTKTEDFVQRELKQSLDQCKFKTETLKEKQLKQLPDKKKEKLVSQTALQNKTKYFVFVARHIVFQKQQVQWQHVIIAMNGNRIVRSVFRTLSNI